MSTDNPLKIVEAQKGLPHRTQNKNLDTASRELRDQQARAYFERQWLVNAENFDPGRSARERERIDRTWTLIKPLLETPELAVVDAGFGWGVLTRKVRGQGARVDAVDIAENAIKHFYSQGECGAALIRDTFPMTALRDDVYDLAICTDLIAELAGHDQRLLLSELYRILKPEGRVVLSTPLDHQTDGALEKFAQLVDTEFEVIDWEVSHHAYLMSLLYWLQTSARFVRAASDPAYYKELDSDRGRLGRLSLKMNTSFPLVYFWKGLDFIMGPVSSFVKRSRGVMLFLEGLCRSISPDRGVTHAICLARLRAINTTEPIDVDKVEPQTQRLRQRVWE